MAKNTIFKRLVEGEIISPEDPESYKLKEASYNTKRLLLQMNNTSEPQKIRQFLSQIIDSEIDESVTIFTPFHINYGKNTQIGKNVFINFDCVFLDLGGITIEEITLLSINSVEIEPYNMSGLNDIYWESNRHDPCFE